MGKPGQGGLAADSECFPATGVDLWPGEEVRDGHGSTQCPAQARGEADQGRESCGDVCLSRAENKRRVNLKAGGGKIQSDVFDENGRGSLVLFWPRQLGTTR